MPLSVSLPEGYVATGGPSADAFAVPGAAAWLAVVMAAGATLHGWASRHPARRELRGRGQTWAVPVPGSPATETQRWVVRHYHRGGAMAPWLRDRYLALGEPRPVKELRASLEAARRGIATPEVVGGAVYPAGAFYRADLVTAEIPGGVDLAEILFGDAQPGIGAVGLPVPAAALAAAGALVGALARAGVRHPDLHAGNVVLQPSADGVRAWLVDLDRCAFGAGGSERRGARMLRRLERSLRNLGARSGRPLGDDAWAALAAGFASQGAGA